MKIKYYQIFYRIISITVSILLLQACSMGGQLLKEADSFKNVTKDEIVIVKKFDCEHYRKVEGWLHRQHAAKRVEGEWFILEDSDIHLFESDCEKINETIKLLIETNPFYNKKG